MPTDPTPLLEQVRYLLCDADGNLFPSEEPAFDASVEVTNAFLAAIGSHRRFTAEELRLASTGMNFRTTALRLAAEAGVDDVDIEPWVAEEKRAVSAHLARTLQPHEAKMSRDVRLANNYFEALFQSRQIEKVTKLLNALAGSPSNMRAPSANRRRRRSDSEWRAAGRHDNPAGTMIPS